MSIVETEIQGIRTLFAERDDGVVSGGLVFRVGWADENLAVRGLTHLVTHLVLADVGTRDAHHYGDTHATHTHVHVEGTARQVSHVLSGVCEALASPAMERLEALKDVIRAERRWRPEEVPPDALFRHGARGFGLAAYPELGLPGIGPDLVRLWIAETFTRGNAVLWLTGDRIPDDLVLPLAGGAHQPLPDPGQASADGTTGLVPTPAWYGTDAAEVRVTGVVPRSPAARVFADVLDAFVRQELCERDAVSPTAGATHVVRDADATVVGLTAACLPGRRAAAVGGVVDVLARLRWGSVPDAVLETARAGAVADAERATVGHASLAERAVDELLGIPVPDPTELAEAYRSVGPSEIRATAEAFHASAIAGVPGRGPDWAGWTAVPTSSTVRVRGERYEGRGGHPVTLVVGDDAVGTVSEVGRSTVRYEEVAVMTAYEDGGRHLIGLDGFQVHVEPTLFRLDDDVVARVDAAVDLARVVRRPARDPEDLPVPPGPGSTDGDEPDGLDLAGAASGARPDDGRRPGWKRWLSRGS